MIVLIWVMLTLVNYYYIPFFFIVLNWLGMSLVLLIWTIVQTQKTIKERNNLSKQRIISTLTIFVLFIFTFYRKPVNRLIEQADWRMFYSKRIGVINLIKEGKLTPNEGWNNWTYELPYEFPIISNNGNEIEITRNDSTKNMTVTFWIFRNYFNAPSTYFVYTDDQIEISKIEDIIKNNPEDNWKITNNWYRRCHK